MDAIEFDGLPLDQWDPVIGDLVELRDGREVRLVGVDIDLGGNPRFRASGGHEFGMESVRGVTPMQRPRRYVVRDAEVAARVRELKDDER